MIYPMVLFSVTLSDPYFKVTM